MNKENVGGKKRKMMESYSKLPRQLLEARSKEDGKSVKQRIRGGGTQRQVPHQEWIVSW